MRELKEDLADCSARQITLLVDQSFSGELVHELRHSPAHRNLLVFASGKSGEYSFDDEFTRFWAACNHTRSCSTDIHTVRVEEKGGVCVCMLVCVSVVWCVCGVCAGGGVAG